MLVTLAWAPWLVGLLTVVFLLVCVMLILTILIQRPQGGGLSGAFGSGAGSGQTAFGAKTGDALTWFTIIVFVLFVGFAVVLNYANQPDKLPPGGATVQPASGAPGATPATTGDKSGEQPQDAGKVEVTPTAPPTEAKPTDAVPTPPPAQPAPAPTEPKPEDKPATPPADAPKR